MLLSIAMVTTAILPIVLRSSVAELFTVKLMVQNKPTSAAVIKTMPDAPSLKKWDVLKLGSRTSRNKEAASILSKCKLLTATDKHADKQNCPKKIIKSPQLFKRLIPGTPNVPDSLGTAGSQALCR